MTEIYATHSGKSPEELDVAIDRDFYLSADDAMKWGLVDHVVKFRKGAKA
jgi:ATP-dependent Clp protease protease subunit